MTSNFVNKSLQARSSILNEVFLEYSIVTSKWHLSFESLTGKWGHNNLAVPLELISQPLKTSLPVFRVKESSVRRRYSDFEWLRNELERDSKIVVPPLPSKALKRQMPFRSDDGIFEEDFIEDRRSGLEGFVNKIAGHPLAQNERCLHMFLQETNVDRNYVPGKIRNT
jgi:hypothetical protein